MKECSYKKLAYLHFWPECNGRAKPGWVLHHIDPSWKTENPERYAKWNIEDLIPMTLSEHTKWHAENDPEWINAKKTETARQRMSFSHLGEKNPNYGKHRSVETKMKISESLLGLNVGNHWYNNGVINVFKKECPEGFVKGMLK